MLPERQIFHNRRSTTYDKLVEKTGRSRATIKRMVKRLKQEGFIARVGSDKTGYWRITSAI
ncbi:MAG: MarR family transcriptional regulator [Prevotellaceae bacterium]|jgi:predicted transcriptional regulator|nr:MarR family transcriptional regulator [Prevotellaceae bacterium]